MKIAMLLLVVSLISPSNLKALDLSIEAYNARKAGLASTTEAPSTTTRKGIGLHATEEVSNSFGAR